MYKKKRGSAMISFHWLLVIIAGGAIILLFTMFINTGQKASETSLSVDVLLHFDTIFSSFVSTEKTESVLPSRKEIELEFTCVQTEGNSKSTINLAGGISKDLHSIVLFSQSLVAGDELYTLSRNFAVPYSVTSLLYVTDPNVLYVIDAPVAQQQKELRSILPRNATVITLGERPYSFIRDIDLDEYRDVVIIGATAQGGQPTSLLAMRNMRLQKDTNLYLYHIVSSEILDSGIVTGYKAQKTRTGVTFTADGTTEYTSDDLLTGMLLSESMPWFTCVKQKLDDKVSRVSMILAQRAVLLAAEPAMKNPICKNIYGLAVSQLEVTVEAPSTYIEASDILQSYNQKLELQSCPLLY